MTASPPKVHSPSWDAQLQLSFAFKNGKTVLTSKKHRGPLVVQRPFYPEGPQCCHIYIVHPPGGIVGGDTLTINTDLDDTSHSLVTTPAATKFYRSNGYVATQNQIINVGKNAILEWLPQETVFFNDANAASKTRINLEDSSRFIAWEIQCLGQPANDVCFDKGTCVQKFEIWQQDQPVLLECNRIQGGEEILNASWGLHQHQALGTMVTSGTSDKTTLEKIKALCKEYSSALCACTVVHDLMIIRAMAKYAEQVRELFILLWEFLRPQVLKLPACPPRIWKT